MMFFVLLLIGRASAIQVEARDGPCPVGIGTVRVYEKISSNAAGGYDSDLASYSSGGQWRAYQLATCSDNLLSLYGSDLLELNAADRQKVAAALPAAVTGVADPKAATLWERYRVAAALYAALGKDDRFLGGLLLEASWAARDEAVGFYAGLAGPAQARALLDAGWEELKKPLSVADRKKVLYNLARIAHRGGWADERDSLLSSFEAAGALTPAEVEAIARFRRITREIEPALQDEVIAHFTAALRGELSPDEKTRVTYQLADLLRRRGREREAAPLYFLVLNGRDTPDQLREMATFLAGPLLERLKSNAGAASAPDAGAPSGR
ncbi:MAG: hypothetical protein Q8P41_04485 [Pseudomonadota bacterium]|nr:hypothetical protein [Pseudomonadota bacterium]